MTGREQITVVLTPAHRVQGVRIASTAELRTPAALATAFDAAYAAALADGVRSRARSRRPRGRRPRATAVRPTFQRPTAEQLQRHRIRNETPPSARRTVPAVVTGVSANQCVRVTLHPARSSGTVEADPGWLAHAGPTALASAITEAFHHAYAERDDR